MKKKNLILTISLALITAVISGAASGYVATISQNESIQKEINALQNQTDIQSKRLDAQLENNQLVEEQLETLKKSIEKESQISVKIIPHTLGSTKDVLARYERSGETTTRELQVSPGNIILKEGETVQFDIVVTNVGTDTAIIEKYGSITIMTDFERGGRTMTSVNFAPNGTAISHAVNKILEPNSPPYVIPFWLAVDEDLAPDGRIIFTVLHDKGVSESDLIYYKYRGNGE